MADASDLRRWAIEHGRGTVRGRLPKTLISDWDAAHPADPYEPGDNRDDTPRPAVDDYENLFPDPDAPVADLPDTGEEKPRKPPRRRAAKTAGWNPFGKKTAPKKRKPRVSTEDLLSSLWRGAAKLAAPLPPLHRTLRVQAPVAGILLEDVVKDTAADMLLQPLARFADAGRTVTALLGPPVFVTAITLHVQQTALPDGRPAPNPVFMAMATEGLRSSLMTWMDVAGPKFEEAIKREREFEEKYGADVDEFMNWLFAPPPSTAEEARAEEAMYARATGQAA